MKMLKELKNCKLYCYYNNNLFSSKPCLIFKEKFIAQSLCDGITAFEKTEVPITIDKRTTIEERTTLCPGQGQKKNASFAFRLG